MDTSRQVLDLLKSLPSPGIKVTVYFPFSLASGTVLGESSLHSHWSPFGLQKQRSEQQKHTCEQTGGTSMQSTHNQYLLTEACLNVLCASPRRGREVDNILVGKRKRERFVPNPTSNILPSVDRAREPYICARDN